MTLSTIFLLLLIGAVAGWAAGLLGVGGGIIIVPALHFLAEPLGLPPEHVMHIAAATSTAVIVPTALRSALLHYRRGAVDMDILKRWMIPAGLAGLIATGTSRWIPTGALALLFAVVATVVGLNLASGWLQRHKAWPWPTPGRERIYAALLGLVSAWMGIGGGTVGYPVMTAHGLPPHRAVGTGATLGLAISIPALIGWSISGWGQTIKPACSALWGSTGAPIASSHFVQVFRAIFDDICRRLGFETSVRIIAQSRFERGLLSGPKACGRTSCANRGFHSF
jgi:uncharacterized protein